MCDLLEGQFIEFSERSKICVNPFTYLKITESVDLQQIDRDVILKSKDLKDQVEMLKSIVMSAAKRDPENKTEDSFVEQAIISAIQQKGNKATFTTVYEELLKLNDDKGRTKDIAESIKSYTKHGIHGQYFEGDSTLDFSNNLIVLELEELKAKGQLCFVVLLILMLKITQEMYLGDRSQKKICIIDEAWDLIGKGNSGSFIETGYRRARKYGGAFLTATQSIDDYYVSNNTQACWNNADIKFLLRQGSEPENVKLDEYTSNLLKTVSTETGIFSEVLIIIGSQTCGICRLIVDPFSAYIYSSKAPEVELLSNIKSYEKMSIRDAVWKAIALTESTIKRFNIDRDKVAEILVERIKTHGYASLTNFLR